MSKPSASKTTALEAALLASHSMLTTPIKRPSARPQTPPPPISTPLPTVQPSTPSPQTIRTPTLQTPRAASTPATPRAPRKRSFFEYDPSTEAVTSKRARTKPSALEPTPSKPRCSRKKNVLTFDRVTCIPMHTLRAQKDDTSALLRPLSRRSDYLRKLVDMRIAKELEKVRAPGCTGILDAAVWSPRRKDGVKKVDAATGTSRRKTRGVKKV